VVRHSGIVFIGWAGLKLLELNSDAQFGHYKARRLFMLQVQASGQSLELYQLFTLRFNQIKTW